MKPYLLFSLVTVLAPESASAVSYRCNFDFSTFIVYADLNAPYAWKNLADTSGTVRGSLSCILPTVDLNPNPDLGVYHATGATLSFSGKGIDEAFSGPVSILIQPIEKFSITIAFAHCALFEFDSSYDGMTPQESDNLETAFLNVHEYGGYFRRFGEDWCAINDIDYILRPGGISISTALPDNSSTAALGSLALGVLALLRRSPGSPIARH